MSLKYLQTQTYYLAGSGAVIGATSITLKSMLDIDGNALTMTADFGTVGYATIDPGNATLEEQISFTGLTNNSNGTTTLTGVSSVTFASPYTATSGLAKTHAGAAPFVISNTSGFYGTFANKQNTETITGYWAVPDPVSLTDIANKQYVLSVVSGGTVSINKPVPAATAGETVAAGNVVYLKTSDGFWYLAKANDTTKIFNVQLGIAQGAGTSGNSITGGVLIAGLDSNQSGLAAGTTYYVNNSGAVSATPGDVARIIGQGGQTATTFYFNPNYNFLSTNDIQMDALAGENLTANDAVFIKTSDGKAYKTDADDLTLMNFAGFAVATVSTGGTAQIRLNNKINLSSLVTGSRYYVSGTSGAITATAPTNVTNVGVALSSSVLLMDKFLTKRTVAFTTPGANTWTKRPGLKFVEVELVGGGGGGGGNTTANTSSNGGGGGGYSKKIIPANTLTDIVTATVGAAGAAGAAAGGDGGAGGTTSFGAYLQATGGTGGDSSSTAGPSGVGGVGSSGDINIKGQGGGGGGNIAGVGSGCGGSSHLGGGALAVGGGANAAGLAGGNYGGGGSGAAVTGGGADTLGGAGAAGIIVVNEYY